MTALDFRIITDLNEARDIWEQFSPHQAIDDEWEFRQIWVEEYNFPLHFIVGYEGEKPVGLLPLQQNTLKGLSPKLLQKNEPFLEFFGGIDTDNNKILTLPGYEYYTADFLKQITSPAVLTDLLLPYEVNGVAAEYTTDRFEANLEGLKSFEDFLFKNLSGKSRQAIMNKVRNLYKNFKVEIRPGTQEDLNLLFEYSIQKFGADSSFNMEDRKRIYQNIYKNFPNDLFVIYLNDKPSAVAFCLIYKNTYISLNIGYDYESRYVAKLLVATEIQRAIEKGCTKFDAGKGENGWKEQFHLTPIPQYKLELNIQG